MKITRGAWQKYITVLRKLNSKATEDMAQRQRALQNAVDAGEISSDDAAQALTDYAYAIATKYGEGAAAASCEMYDAVAELQGARVPAAVPAQTATYGEAAKTVYGVMKQSQDQVPAAVGRLVKQAGVDTTMHNAIRDGAEWAWIPSGDSCAFCLVLASQGWVRASKKVLDGDHASHIHNHCDCTFAIRFDGKSTVEGYDPDALRAQYDAAEGNTPQEKINSMRRDHYAANKDAINAQKRAAYARRNATNEARAIDAFKYEDDDGEHKYTSSDLLEELQSSPIGIDTIRAIRDNNVTITISDEMREDKRGDQQGNQIKIYCGSCRNRRVAGQTLIHEMAHIRFGIGQCQHAEAICFAMEKMHKEGRNYLTMDEWAYVKKLAIDNYTDYNWNKGGYGDYGQFDFVK